MFHVLFLCTGNSARSILAESILNRLGTARLIAHSAGSMPTGKVNPYALELLRSLDYPTKELRSKNWDEFATADTPAMDFVITVCDSAANEVCPIWPGQPVTAHWGLPDPAAVEGSEAVKQAAFADTYRILYNRLDVFVNLPMECLDRLSIQQKVREIGKSAGPNTA